MTDVSRPAVSSFDPDAPDPAWEGEWDVPGRAGDGSSAPRVRLGDEGRSAPVPDGVWIDPFEHDASADEWIEPFDDIGDDTPTARADRAYGAAVDPGTPTAVLRGVVEDIARWNVDALLAEAAIHAGDMGERDALPASERPEVVVLRALLRHPNRPEDLGDLLLRGWLEDPTARSPWAATVAMGTDDPIDPDLLVTAVTEACDAARPAEPPAWSLLLTAAAAARPDGDAVLDLLALVGFPHEQPVRLWPDAESAATGLPGGVRNQARTGAEALGWDGRRLPGLAAALAALVHERDRARRESSFAPTLELCPHGPVVVTPTSVTLPASARGAKPYVAVIVGSHPVFRLKRDWPDRSDAPGGTSWSWQGARVLESRGLGCDRCRQDRDRDKRYLLSTGTDVADVRLSLVERALTEAAETADAADAG